MQDVRPSYHAVDRSRMKYEKRLIDNEMSGQRRIVNIALRMTVRAVNGGIDPDNVDVGERKLIKPVSRIRRAIACY